MIPFIGGVIVGAAAIPAALVGWMAWMDRRSDHRHALEVAAREDAGYCGEAVSSPRPAVAISGLREVLDAQTGNPRAFPGRTSYEGVEPRAPRDRPGPGMRA